MTISSRGNTLGIHGFNNFPCPAENNTAPSRVTLYSAHSTQCTIVGSTSPRSNDFFPPSLHSLFFFFPRPIANRRYPRRQYRLPLSRSQKKIMHRIRAGVEKLRAAACAACSLLSHGFTTTKRASYATNWRSGPERPTSDLLPH